MDGPKLEDFVEDAQTEAEKMRAADVDVLTPIDRDIEDGGHTWDTIEITGVDRVQFLVRCNTSEGDELALDVGEIASLFVLHNVDSFDELIGKPVPIIRGEHMDGIILAVEGTDVGDWLTFVYNEGVHDVSELQ